MPRRSAATVRPLEPDSRYKSRLVQQLINKVMLHGKKSTAERIVYDALAIIGERSGDNPVEELEAAVKQLTPVLEVRSRRSAVRPTRFRSRFPPDAPAPWRCAGSSSSHARATRR